MLTILQEASFRLLEGQADPLPDAAQDEEWEDIADEAQDAGKQSNLLVSDINKPRVLLI